MSEQNVRRNRCDNCTWYDHSEGGLCRRYPPHPKSGLPGVGGRLLLGFENGEG